MQIPEPFTEEGQLKAIVEGIERHCIYRNFNYIECDKCGDGQTLDRAWDNFEEARSYGWSCEGEPRVDLCPRCNVAASLG